MRILFVLKYRAGGDYADWGEVGTKGPLSSGLFNSARMVHEMLLSHRVQCRLVHVIDNNTIHREAVAFKADVVIIEAFWVVPEKFDELFTVLPNVQFIVRNHSEYPFLANEGIALDWTLKYLERPNVTMACNAVRALEDMRSLYRAANPHKDDAHNRVIYLPNWYNTAGAENRIRHKYHERAVRASVEHNPGKRQWYIDVGCFGAIRPLKNHLNQAIAAIRYAQKYGLQLRFHVNGGRIEMGGAPIIKNLEGLFAHYPLHQLVNHGWQEHAGFCELVGEMDVVMQVTFSETFNIVAADAVNMGVPVIVTREVPWSVPLGQVDPNSTDSMVTALRHATHDWGIDYRLANLYSLRAYCAESERHWLKAVEDWTARYNAGDC